ncbi:MAG: N-acetylmuramoyl-L-alanine amidase, family 2, partial [Frankiales bacterium]|nr:N-acetylmuramoyl-L-alanine amidase, family 2 [Frankiales bacterium]
MRSRPRASLALSVLVLPLVLVAPVATLPSLPGSGVKPVPAALHTLALPVPAATGGLRTASVATTVSLPAARTADFSTLGVTWRPGSADGDLDVEVRTRTGGAWTGWKDLGGSTDDAPDADSADAVRSGAREGTRPAWVGPSDGVQVRAVVTSGRVPADLRVDLIDPGTSPADVVQKTPLSVAGASEPQPLIVSRAEWGADESMRTCFSGYTGTPRVAFVHHTDSTNDYTPEQAPAAVRGFYAYHVKSRGWCDIAYNFLVDRYGVVYEGRYGGIDKAVLGAHTGGFNTNSFGTAMIGTFSTVSPPAALRSSLARLLAWKLGRSYADPLGTGTLTSGSGSKFAAGTTHTFSVISGHRDAVDTTCPGDLGYAILGQLRQDVRTLMGASFVAPSAAPLTTTTTPVSLTSGLLQPLSWRLEVTSVATGEVVRSLTGSGTSRVDTSWDLRDGTGAPAPAGSYRATLYGGPDADPALPWSTAVTIQP